MTINRFCSSGLQSIAMAAERIRGGGAEAIVAGGVESMSFVPMGGNKPSLNPWLVDNYPGSYLSMGLTAERVAAHYGITRDQMDQFAYESHQKALAAIAAGRFDDEIVAVPVTNTTVDVNGKAGATKVKAAEFIFTKDEGPRADTSLDALAKLKPVFHASGTVTAGNSSQMSRWRGSCGGHIRRARRGSLASRALARLVAFATAGCDPEEMGIGPVYAIPKALKMAGPHARRYRRDRVERGVRGAVAGRDQGARIDPAKVNVNGGAIALGHPLGCSGAKLTATILREMPRRSVQYGMVTMCVGGGMGAAGIFESLTRKSNRSIPWAHDFTTTRAKRIHGGASLSRMQLPPTASSPRTSPRSIGRLRRPPPIFATNEVCPAHEAIEAKDFAVRGACYARPANLASPPSIFPRSTAAWRWTRSPPPSSPRTLPSRAVSGHLLARMSGIGTLPIVWYGTPEQKQKYLPKLATGEWIGAYALSESTSGSDALNARTRAVLSADGTTYIAERREDVDHQRRHSRTSSPCSPNALSRTKDEKLTAFLIESGTPGFTVGHEEHKLGIRGSSTCPLILADCKIPAANLLGEVGKGHHIAFNILNIGRYKLGATVLGAAKTALNQAIRYAKERKAFGKPICEFGLIQEKLADCAAGIFAGEALCYRTIGMIDAALAGVDKSDTARNPEAHRGVRGRVLHREGVGVGDAGHGGGSRGADLRRLRLRGGVSGGAPLSRFAHQPHLRGHERDQPADHQRLDYEVGDVGQAGAAAGDQDADGRGDGRARAEGRARRSAGRRIRSAGQRQRS